MGLILPGIRTRQPSQAPRAAWSNPLTVGLIAACLPHLRVEAVNNGKLTQVGAFASSASTPGVAMETNGSNSNIYFPIPQITLAAWTIFALVKSSTATFDARAVNFGLSTDTNPYIQVGVENTGTTKVRVLAQGNGGTLPANQTSVGVAFNGIPHFVVLTYDGQNVRCYIDGILDTTAPTSAGALWTINQISVGALQRSSGSAFYAGSTYIAGGHNRALSDSEIKRLSANPWQLFVDAPQRRLLVEAPASGPDVTVALSGQTITASRGTISPSNAILVTGSSATVAAGSVSVGSDVTVALAGQAVTTSRGTLAPSSANALTGQSSTAALGSVSPSAALALTGQASSAQQGLMTPARAIVVTGQTATAATGSAGAGIATALAGQTSTTQSGTVSASGNVVVALSGQAATVAQGSMAAFAASAAKFNQSTIMRATVTNRSSTARATSIAASSTMRSSFSQSTIMRFNPLNATATMSDAAINRTANLL